VRVTGRVRQPLRLGVYCDFSYRVSEGGISAELPFSLFIEGLAPYCERLVVYGRVDPALDPYPYRLQAVELVGLPYYRSGAEFGAVMRAIPLSIRRFWRTLHGLDVVWVLGPNPPQAQLFALLAMLRGRRVVLGVRQNLPELIRHRRPGRRGVIVAAQMLEWGFRALARMVPTVVVGPDLAQRYRRARALLNLYVSLLHESDVRADDADPRPSYDDETLVMLSVGRLDPEKNPLLLADVLYRALQIDGRWRLDVCGDGLLAEALADHAERIGVSDRLKQHGYVPIHEGLWGFYRGSHALLHVSMTEGVPQVILEAFAAGLPVVATDVGGVGNLVNGRGLLVEPSDPQAAAVALDRLVRDAPLRARLVDAARQAAADHTMEAECARLADFLSTNS
jgi:glycosyltransferase involved in cell wall biosynthesis